MEKEELFHMERKLLILYNTMSDDAKIWFVAKAVELSERFPSADLRAEILQRHCQEVRH